MSEKARCNCPHPGPGNEYKCDDARATPFPSHCPCECHKANKPRMGRPTVNIDRVRRAAELIKRGVTVSEAARTCGVHRNTLGRYGVQRQNIPSRILITRTEHRPYGETMMDVLLSAVPDGVHEDVREEIIQQLAVEILSGDKAYALLRTRAIEIKHRINKIYHDKFTMRSLSDPIGDGSITLGDTMVR